MALLFCEIRGILLNYSTVTRCNYATVIKNDLLPDLREQLRCTVNTHLRDMSSDSLQQVFRSAFTGSSDGIYANDARDVTLRENRSRRYVTSRVFVCINLPSVNNFKSNLNKHWRNHPQKVCPNRLIYEERGQERDASLQASDFHLAFDQSVSSINSIVIALEIIDGPSYSVVM